MPRTLIRADGRRRGCWAALATAVALTGCGPDTTGNPVGDFPPFLAFGCGYEARFLAVFTGPDSVRLVSADGIHTLVRVPSASGARYAGASDTLWTKGRETLLIRGSEVHRGCTPTGRQRVLTGLRREGALFTAAGNEPFWSLTAWPDSLVLLLDMGSTRLTHVLAGGESPDWRDVTPVDFADANAGIAIAMHPGPCVDTMSGEPFPAEVAVRWGDRDLRGCGIALRPRAP